MEGEKPEWTDVSVVWSGPGHFSAEAI